MTPACLEMGLAGISRHAQAVTNRHGEVAA